MKIKTNFLILIFFLFNSTLSPQRPNGKEKIQQEANPPQSENIWHEIEKYKDSIKISATEAERSKKVISLNEPYLKNLDKKIEKLKKENTPTAKKSKGEIIIPPNSIEVKVYHLDSTCLETRNWIGRQLHKDECRIYKVDTLWATIK